jgi:hypothetical protein
MEILMFTGIAAILMIPVAIGIAAYVLMSLGLYRMAKNRGNENAWLAWIPIGNAYIMGYLSEASPYVKKKFPKMHVIYPAVMGIYVAVIIAFQIIFSFSVPFWTGISSGFFGYSIASMIAMVIFIWLFALFIAVLAYFVLYHIYKTYDPNNAVLYTILSIFGLSSIFLFVIRNKTPDIDNLITDDNAHSTQDES